MKFTRDGKENNVSLVIGSSKLRNKYIEGKELPMMFDYLIYSDAS